MGKEGDGRLQDAMDTHPDLFTEDDDIRAGEFLAKMSHPRTRLPWRSALVIVLIFCITVVVVLWK